METVQFKKNSGAAEETFDAVIIEPQLITDDTRYIDFAGNRHRIVFHTYKKWSITFAKLTIAQMDYLLELQAEEEPQMILDSITYNIDIENVRPKYKSGTISVINREPEA